MKTSQVIEETVEVLKEGGWLTGYYGHPECPDEPHCTVGAMRVVWLRHRVSQRTAERDMTRLSRELDLPSPTRRVHPQTNVIRWSDSRRSELAVIRALTKVMRRLQEKGQ